jgi:hypothetical protein
VNSVSAGLDCGCDDQRIVESNIVIAGKHDGGFVNELFLAAFANAFRT